jgi:preprotein translocase subunit SecY
MKFSFPIEKVSQYIPSIEKPTYRQTVNTKLKWTGVALLLYFALSSIQVVGIQASNFEQLRFYEIVLGSKFGSLLTLGIGPIVTSGILLQLLVGSKIIDWDTTKPEQREKFQMWNKFLAIVLCFVEGIAFVLAGTLPVTGGPFMMAFVVVQLAAGAMLVILLDELVSKWGFGSGVSLFIAAGVGRQILIGLFSPFTPICDPSNLVTCVPTVGNPPNGKIWAFIFNIFSNDTLGARDALVPVVFSIIMFLVVVYVQDVRVEIPLAFSSLRGFGRSWSLKLLYTSNIPVILTAAIIANMQLLATMTAAPVDGTQLNCGFLGCIDTTTNQPQSGAILYLTPPRTLVSDMLYSRATTTHFVRVGTYTAFLCIFAMIFSIFWVTTSGMDAESVAEQIEGIGLQIPGYRRDRRIIQSVLDKYIPALAVMGGLVVGILTAFADITGTIGTGTGMLLTVMIVYNYYEELSSQRLDEAHPFVRQVFGKE